MPLIGVISHQVESPLKSRTPFPQDSALTMVYARCDYLCFLVSSLLFYNHFMLNIFFCLNVFVVNTFGFTQSYFNGRIGNPRIFLR